MNEVTIQIRPNTVSVQGDNIQADTEQAKQILQNALDALQNKPAEEYKNELVFTR